MAATAAAAAKSKRGKVDDLENIEFETSEDVVVKPTFDSMKLKEELLRGIYGYGKLRNLV